MSELKKRWTSEKKLQGETALMKGVAYPFEKTNDQLQDLRGIEITDIIKGIQIRSIDLSGSNLEGFGQFAKCSVERVRFRSASLGTNIGNYFNFCDFSSVKAMGAILRGQFIDCDFTMANLSGVRGSQVQFVRCIFDKTNFSRVVLLRSIFEDCKFENCKFSNGSLSYSKFIRSPINAADLHATLMEKVQFVEGL